jgi:NitT/TauT family transport system substrate-binding protein
VESKIVKASASLFEKKSCPPGGVKKIPRCRIWYSRRSNPQYKKFFAAFFQKSSACLPTLLGAVALAPAAHADMQTVPVFQAFQSIMYLPLYVAIDQGIFAKNGLDVQKVTAGSGASAVAAVIGGHADFSLQDPMTAVLADKRGASVVNVAMVVDGVPVWVLAPPKSGASGVGDLAGKSVSVALPPSTSTYLFERLIKQQNLPVTLDTVQIGTELAPVAAGRAAAAALYEPQVDEGIASGYKIVYSFASQYPGDYAFSNMDTLQSTIDDNPRMVQAFVTSMGQAEALIASSPATARAVAEKEFPTLPKNVVDTAVDRLIKDDVYAKKPDITPEAFKNALALQEFIGNVKPGSVAYSKVVDDKFALNAK